MHIIRAALDLLASPWMKQKLGHVQYVLIIERAAAEALLSPRGSHLKRQLMDHLRSQSNCFLTLLMLRVEQLLPAPAYQQAQLNTSHGGAA